MKWFDSNIMRLVLVGFVAAIVLCGGQIANAATINQAPVADAGSSRYAAQDPVVLDGTSSYDPDKSGTLTYTWEQIAGPPVIIIDADTATPTIGGSLQPGTGRDLEIIIGGFPQTDEIQECEFELVVSDGELTSLPDTVKVIIVRDFGVNKLYQLNPPFDPGRPTLVGFAGVGGCQNCGPWTFWNRVDWYEKVNFITYEQFHASMYENVGDMFIAYLSSQAPDYKQPIQTFGHSAGGEPAIDIAIYLNETYADRRYAVNRVTLLDAAQFCQEYQESIDRFLVSAVDGEQCWVENYISTLPGSHSGYNYQNFQLNVLNVGFKKAADNSLTWQQRHNLSHKWYRDSLTVSDINQFNHAVVAGSFWSVVGPGKNLQLASTPGVETYKFTWYGDEFSGYMDFFDESLYPDRLPEPVTLMAWRDSLDSNSIVLTCKESENAVGYELLFGPDPYRVMDYNIVSDTSIPPYEVITDFPFEETWWTIRARDQHGSTIYADPMRIDLENLPWPTIENLTTGQTYGCIQAAIDHATSGDEIVIGPGIYDENIDFEGKNLTVTSTNPNDPTIVATTVINGVGQCPVVTLSRCQGTDCVLKGLTITGGIAGISCGDASPTIRNCTIESTGPNSIEFLYGYEPIIIDCDILEPIREVYDPRLMALWKMDETEGSIAFDSIGINDGICYGEPIWQPNSGMLAGALEFDGIDDCVSTDFVLSPSDDAFSVFAWIKGVAPGQVIVSQERGMNWLMTDISNGALRTDLRQSATPGRNAKPGGPPLICSTVVTNSDWHRVGFVRDGSYRTLYVDDIAVAEDTQDSLDYSDGGLYLGCGKSMEAGTFFSGLIDDVRIYNRVVRP